MPSTATKVAGAVTGTASTTRPANERRRARRLHEDARQFVGDGQFEAKRLLASVFAYGAGTTLRRELAREREYIADADTAAGTVLRAGQSGSQLVGVMLTITLAAAIGFVGTKVTSEIDSSIDTTDGTAYDNASNSISQGFADAMGLTDIVFLVLMFGVILTALLAFRSRR